MARIFLALMLLLPLAVQAREWYEGGSLHNATVEQFCQASPQNRLATAGDWMAGMADSGLLHGQNQESLKDAADAIQECMVKGSEGIQAAGGQKAVNMAVLCMAMLKEKYPWLLSKKTGDAK